LGQLPQHSKCEDHTGLNNTLIFLTDFQGCLKTKLQKSTIKLETKANKILSDPNATLHRFLPFMQQQEVLCGEERSKVALAPEVVKIKLLKVDTSSVLMLKGDCVALFSSFHSNLPSGDVQPKLSI